MGKFKDLTGKTFGKLTVIERAANKVYPSGQTRLMWYCKCKCGNTVIVLGQCLVNGHSRSCGCSTGDFIRQQKNKHKKSKTKIYRIWQAMKRRCYNPNSINYSDYGSRGIEVCERWKDSFEAFYDDVSKLAHYGEKGYTLNRIDNDGNYDLGNVEWSTDKEQANNRRNNHLITYNGKTQTVKQWSEELNINNNTIITRLSRGWSIERTLNKP